jgi:hypothetical protein
MTLFTVWLACTAFTLGAFADGIAQHDESPQWLKVIVLLVMILAACGAIVLGLNLLARGLS